METKHTPGPWRTYVNTSTEGWTVDNYYPRGGNHDGLIVANLGHGPYSEANAHLIEAAPDLLDVLKRLRSFLQSPDVKIEARDVDYLVGDGIFAACDSAIIKAEAPRCQCGAVLTAFEAIKGGMTCRECHAREAEVNP